MYPYRWEEKMENSIDCFIAKYKKLPVYEKILDAMLIIAVSMTLLFLFLEHVAHVAPHTVHILHRIDMVLAIVFVADLLRTYKKSTHWTHFVKNNWIDVAAILILMVVFSSMVYPAAGRVTYLLKVERLHKVTKFYHLKHASNVVN